MPTVKVKGTKKKFPYDAAGEKQAAAYAKRTGGKLTMKRGAKKKMAPPMGY